jgi:cold shock CspA family protein
VGKRWQSGDLAAALRDSNNLRAQRDPPPQPARLTGAVLFYDPCRAWGFIVPDGASDRAANVFLHANALDAADLVDDPVTGDRFEFEIALGPAGKPEARRLVKLEPLE